MATDNKGNGRQAQAFAQLLGLPPQGAQTGTSLQDEVPALAAFFNALETRVPERPAPAVTIKRRHRPAE